MRCAKNNKSMYTKNMIARIWYILVTIVIVFCLCILKSYPTVAFIIAICDAVALFFMLVYTVKELRCPNCDEIEPGSKYCKYCGTIFDNESKN